MEEYPVLVKPIDYPLNDDNVLRCYNCGGNLFRVVKEYGILKEETVGLEEKTKNPFRTACIDVTFYCAVCGRANEGFFQVDPDDVEKGGFDSIEAADRHLRWKKEKEESK